MFISHGLKLDTRVQSQFPLYKKFEDSLGNVTFGLNQNLYGVVKLEKWLSGSEH